MSDDKILHDKKSWVIDYEPNFLKLDMDNNSTNSGHWKKDLMLF